MTVVTPVLPHKKAGEEIFSGRINVLYALGRHYLSLPFAVLCVPATLLAGGHLGVLPVIPLLLLIPQFIWLGYVVARARRADIGRW